MKSQVTISNLQQSGGCSLWKRLAVMSAVALAGCACVIGISAPAAHASSLDVPCETSATYLHSYCYTTDVSTRGGLLSLSTGDLQHFFAAQHNDSSNSNGNRQGNNQQNGNRQGNNQQNGNRQGNNQKGNNGGGASQSSIQAYYQAKYGNGSSSSNGNGGSSAHHAGNNQSGNSQSSIQAYYQAKYSNGSSNGSNSKQSGNRASSNKQGKAKGGSSQSSIQAYYQAKYGNGGK